MTSSIRKRQAQLSKCCRFRHHFNEHRSFQVSMNIEAFERVESRSGSKFHKRLRSKILSTDSAARFQISSKQLHWCRQFEAKVDDGENFKSEFPSQDSCDGKLSDVLNISVEAKVFEYSINKA